MEPFENVIKEEFLTMEENDGSHDMGYLKRVSALSVAFANIEKGNEFIGYTAGMFHDIVSLPKNHLHSKESSFLVSERTKIFLKELNFKEEWIRAKEIAA